MKKKMNEKIDEMKNDIYPNMLITDNESSQSGMAPALKVRPLLKNSKMPQGDNGKQKIVFIEWIDATIWGNEPVNRKKAEDYGLTHGFVCGFLVHEDKEKVIVAMDWFDVQDDLRTVCTYPKTGIIKMIVKDYPIKLK